ncbi:MAG TPA: class I SAM-dependent methyltransferase [Candidatus Limnocylindrales bacterium]
MKWFRRGKNTSPIGGSPTEVARSANGRRRPGARRFFSAVLLFGALAALTRPGRSLARALARRLDAHVEPFSEPGSATYARVFAPLLGHLYRRVAEDVALELSSRIRSRRATILDLGCGPGDLVVAISQRIRDARIVGLDLSPSMLLWASRHATTAERLRFIVADAAALPFGDASVDLVVSTLSLHHWPDPTDVFAEIARVLRPGGVALIYDLGLLTYGPAEMADIADGAGLEPADIGRERLDGGFVSRFFIRFTLEG